MRQNLFKHNTLEKMCSTIEPSETQINDANKWLEYLSKDQLTNEKENYLIFSKLILESLLGYNTENLNHEVGNIEFSYPKVGSPVLGIEAKGTKTDIFSKQKRRKEWHDTPIHQLWSYMGEMNLKYGIVTNYESFVLIDKNEGISKVHIFNFKSIESNVDNLKEFIAVFSRKYLIDDNFVNELKEKSKLEEREFTNEFYGLFSETRLMLIQEFEQNGATKAEAIHYAQLFLNRLMFIFFCEDTGKLRERTFENLTSDVLRAKSLMGNLLCSQLKNLFNALNVGSNNPGAEVFGFNGGLFSERIPEHINFYDFRPRSFFKIDVTSTKNKAEICFNSNVDQLLYQIDGELSPIITNLLFMSSYDFKTEISVNILGHIFEQSLNDIESLKEGITISKRKKDGVYYTPEYITEYICNSTIIPYLSKNNATSIEELILEHSENIEELENKFQSIKILDPACGSGAFLIKAVDLLLAIHKEIQYFKEFEGQYVASSKHLKKKRRKSRQKDMADHSQFTFDKWNEEDEARNIIENNIYGVDINEESVDVTKLSLFLKIAKKNKKLIDLSDRIKCGNSLVDYDSLDERAFCWETEFKEILDDGGFDIIVGNPPYGAKLTKEEQKYFIDRYSISSTDTAQLMMKKSHSLLKNGGFNGFIIPKAFVYASNWKNIRDLFLPDINFIVDCKKVWNEVKLEQVIYVTRKSCEISTYDTKYRDNELIISKGTIDKKYCSQFDFILNNTSNEELNLGLKIQNRGDVEFGSNKRGDGLQKNIKPEGTYPVLGGANVQRYSIEGIKGYIVDGSEFKDNAKIISNSILAQNIISHIENPTDHIKIMATIPDDNYLIIDTINQIRFDESISNKYALALINSKLISWYVYRFIFAKAIRTMHFDSGVTSRILIPKISIKEQSSFIEAVDSIMSLNKKRLLKKDKFLRRVEDNFGIEVSNKGILSKFHQIQFKRFIKELSKYGVKLTLKKQDEWEDYFNEYKEELNYIEKEINKIDINIDKMVYSLYQLTDSEKNIIEI